MEWKQPPRIKVYEALGAIGEKHIKVNGNEGFVLSSTGGKAYQVLYDPDKNAIIANDNGSYWQGYVGYPAIAFLMEKGIVTYDHRFATALAGFVWKDLNERFKRDYDKTIEYVHSELHKRGFDTDALRKEVDHILIQIAHLHLHKHPSRVAPPSGY